MSTFGNMVHRIALEIGRSDLSKQIETSIKSSICYFEKYPLGFNEKSATIEHKKSQEAVKLPDDVLKVRRVHVHVDQEEYCLTRKNQLEFFQGFGYPKYFGFRQNNLVLAPIPHTDLELCIDYLVKIPEIKSGDADNCWTCEGEELIRTHTKADLYTHILNEYEDAKHMKNWEHEILQQHLNLVEEYEMSGHIKSCHI